MEKWLKKYSIFLVIIFFLIVSIAVFFPILFKINDTIFGLSSSSQDGIQNIWNYWWAKKTCLGFCSNLWNTNYQFYPEGTSLLFHTFSLPNLILMYPFMLLGLSSVSAYNLSLFIALFTSMVTMFLLSNYLTKDKLASVVAGLLYALSPYMIGHIIDGQLNLVTIQFFPLFLLYIIKSDQESKKINYFIAAAALFIIGFNDFNYLIFGFLIWGTYIFSKIITKKINMEFIKKTLMISIIFVIPFFAYSYRHLIEYRNFNLSGLTIWNAESLSAKIGAYVTPPPHTIIGHFFYNDVYKGMAGIYGTKSLYLGFMVILLCIYTIIRYKNKLVFWYLLAGVSLIFSFGPILKIYNYTITSMPFNLLKSIPIINVLKAPCRFDIIAMLSISVLVAYGLCEIRKNKKIKILLIPIVIILAIEYFPVYLPVRVLKIPKGYEKIRDLSADSAILDLPLIWMTGLENKGIGNADPLYYQTFHEKRIASGYVTRAKDEDFEAYNNIPILKYAILSKNRQNIDSQTKDVIDKYQNLTSEDLLKGNPFSYIVFSTYYDTNTKNIKEILKNDISLYYKDDEMEIYKINDEKIIK